MRAHLAIAVAITLAAWQAGVARAGTVSSNVDPTDLNDPTAKTTLRYALTHFTAGDTINITAKGMINLNQGALPTITGDLTITGPGADQLTIKVAAGTVPVFTISSGAKVQISGVTITGGTNDLGGGIDVTDTISSLVLLDSVVSGNQSSVGSGAGIYSNGALTIQHCTIMGNATTIGATAALASAVYSAGTTLITDSTIGPNVITGLTFEPSSPTTTLTVDRVTIANNAATAGIGGFELRSGTATFSNSTFSGNTGPMGGDFWTSANGVALSLVNVTANGSGAPALRFDHMTASTVMLRNTILAGTGMRCMGQVTSMGHNIVSDATCNLTSSNDKQSTDPMLAPLADNGGPSQTHALLFGSPAAGGGDGTNLEQHDQRGFARIQFGTVDVGALEVSEPMITTQPVGATFATGATLTLSVAAQNQHSSSALKFQWVKDGMPIAGATAATFTKASATADDSGTYEVQVINEGGALTSAAADVTVTPGGASGGCCSIGGGGPAQSGGLAILIAAVLGYRRRRAANQRHAG